MYFHPWRCGSAFENSFNSNPFDSCVDERCGEWMSKVESVKYANKHLTRSTANPDRFLSDGGEKPDYLTLSRVTDDSRWKNNEDVIFRLGSIETQILLILHYSLMLPRRPSNNGNDDYISNVITAEAVIWKILASGASIAARKCKWGSVPIIDGADKWNINATCAKHVWYIWHIIIAPRCHDVNKTIHR